MKKIICTVLMALALAGGAAAGYFIPGRLDVEFMLIFVMAAALIMGAVLVLVFYGGQFKQTSEGFKKYRYLLGNLISRDLKVKYRRSFLGLMWSVLNPLLMALVINAVFSNIFKFKIDYFIVYYLTGSLIFNFMSEATSTSLTSVINAASLIKKVYIPKYIFPLEKCLFAFVNMLFSCVALIVVILIVRMPVHLTALMFFFPMICTLIFSMGMSLILSSINVFFRDVGHLYSVWTVAWMYLTPVIYPVDVLPERILPLMKLNPMYHYVTYFRDVVMYGVIPGLNAHLICLLFAFTFLGIGLVMFKKQQDRFILYI